MLTLKVGKPTSYQFTYQPSDPADDKFVDDLRGIIRAFNLASRLVQTGPQFRISLSPRKGQNNPHAWKYDNHHKRRLRLEDACEVDVYVSTRARRGAESRPEV